MIARGMRALKTLPDPQAAMPAFRRKMAQVGIAESAIARIPQTWDARLADVLMRKLPGPPSRVSGARGTRPQPRCSQFCSETTEAEIWPTSPSTRWIWTPARWWPDTTTLEKTLAAAKENLEAVDAAPTAEDPAECVTDKGPRAA